MALQALNLSAIAVGATNITSRAAFGGTYTAAVDGWLVLSASLAGLNGAAATITADVVVTRSGNAIPMDRVKVSAAKTTATATRSQIDVLPFRVVSGDVVQLYLASTNASDTAVTGTVYVDDAYQTSGSGSIVNANVSDYFGQTITGTATAGTTTTITLGSAPTYSLVGSAIYLLSGTGAGQVPQIIKTHTAGTTAVTVGDAWATAPASGTTYMLIPQAAVNVGLWRGSQPNQLSSGNVPVNVNQLSGDNNSVGAIVNLLSPAISGTMQAGSTSTTAVLQSNTSSINNRYRDWWIVTLTGTGSGQIRRISASAGSTKVATLSKPWDTTPDATTVYRLIPSADADVSTIQEQTVTATAGFSFDAQTTAQGRITTALPNAAPAANGGLPTVDASNNVHGLQTRTVSDSSIIGTSTFASGGNVNVTQWGGTNVTGMPMPTYTQPTGFLAADFSAIAAGIAVISGWPVLNGISQDDFYTALMAYINADSTQQTLQSNAASAATNSLSASESASQAATNSQGAKDAAESLLAYGPGDGDTLVDHNFSGTVTINGVAVTNTPKLLITDDNGDGIGNVTLVAYLKSDFDSNAGTAAPRARSTTLDDGTWPPMKLSSGLAYTIMAKNSDLYAEQRIDIVVP